MFYSKYEFILSQCILLNKLDEVSRNKLLKKFHEEYWPKNTCILNSEKFKYSFYILISGRVKMYQVHEDHSKECTLFLLSKGDIFDIFCFLDDCDHPIYYECIDDVKVLAVPMMELKEWFQKHPEHYQNILPYVGKQLRLLENYVSDITFTDISTRLLKLLIRNTGESSRLEMINDLSNKELAYLIGSTGAVVNRHIQKLKRNGSIKTYRNRLEVKDLSVLLHLLELQESKIKKRI